MSIKLPKNYALGAAEVKAFPKVQYDKIKEILDLLNSLASDTGVISAISGSFSGAVTVGSTLAVTGKVTLSSNIVIGATLVEKRTLVAANTTAAATLTVVKAGLLAGGFSSTSAAAVSIVLDSVANIITAFASAGITLAAGSSIEFIIDNSAGANTVTLAVDAGTTIAVATPAITGGATLTVSTANVIGRFQLYLTSATAGILSRLV